jgi:hypothetical protein
MRTNREGMECWIGWQFYTVEDPDIQLFVYKCHLERLLARFEKYLFLSKSTPAPVFKLQE